MASQEAVLDPPDGWVARHVRSYVDTEGRTGHLFHGLPTLLLTTRGRRSHELRRKALIYGRAGDLYVVVASNAGAARHPGWYLNLVAEPDVEVQVAAERLTARARTVAPAERPALWRQMVALFGQYERYHARTSREIPVVILEPRA